jgi:hypothetical protein
MPVATVAGGGYRDREAGPTLWDGLGRAGLRFRPLVPNGPKQTNLQSIYTQTRAGQC